MTPKKHSGIPEDQIEDIKLEIKHYFESEMEIELSDMQAGFVIDFIEEKIGKVFYNRGVTDTIQAVKDKSDDLVLLLKE